MGIEKVENRTFSGPMKQSTKRQNTTTTTTAVKNPNWPEANQSDRLFTSAAEKFNQGLLGTNSTSCQSRS